MKRVFIIWLSILFLIIVSINTGCIKNQQSANEGFSEIEEKSTLKSGSTATAESTAQTIVIGTAPTNDVMSTDEPVKIINPVTTDDPVTMIETVTTAPIQNAESAAETGISIDTIELNRTKYNLLCGQTLELAATFSPSDAVLVWSSDNNDCATVDAGVVKAVGEGTATITAFSNYGGNTASCLIYVYKRNSVISYPDSCGRYLSNDMKEIDYPGYNAPALKDLNQFPVVKKIVFDYSHSTAIFGGEQCLEGLYCLEDLSIGNPRSTIFQNLPDLPSLTNLTLNADIEFEFYPDVSLAGISRLSSLQSLSISHCRLLDCVELSTLPKLQKVCFTKTALLNGLNDISNCTSLKYLEITYCDTEIPALNTLSNLEHLSINSDCITNLDFLNGVTSMQTLFIADNNISDISVIAQMPNLTCLAIDGNPIQDISPILQCKSLKRLILDYTLYDRIDEIRQALPGCEILGHS